jgi:nitrogen fixation protein
MKRAILGILVGLGLAMAAMALAEQRGEILNPRGAVSLAAGTELIVVPNSVGDKTQMLTVVDPRQRAMAVYHIDTATGKITLRSVRNIQWDLQISDLNNDNPLPQQIRSLLEQR